MLSRMEQLRGTGIQHPPMPPNPAPHITAWLTELGLCEAAGMGEGPLSWASVNAWASLTGRALQPWHARLLRRLSADYLTSRSAAEALNCPPPWAVVTEATKAIEIATLDALLG